MKKKIKVLCYDAVFLTVALLFVFFARSELLVTLIAIALLCISFYHYHAKGEILFFFIGCGVGLFFEIIGDLIYELQFWQEASLFGVPIWLPLFWGWGFVMIRRLGELIVKK